MYWRSCIQCVSFPKIDALNIWSLIMVIGIRPKVICVCLCVQMVVCESMNVCQPTNADSYQPADPLLTPLATCILLSLTLDTHTLT